MASLFSFHFLIEISNDVLDQAAAFLGGKNVPLNEIFVCMCTQVV